MRPEVSGEKREIILPSLVGSMNFTVVSHNKLFSNSFTEAAESLFDIRLTSLSIELIGDQKELMLNLFLVVQLKLDL